MSMKRIIPHWTAGTWTCSSLDKKHYHLIIDGDGVIHKGDHAIEDNLNCSDGDYAAHTRGLNTGSIGVALCGMHGAVESPFNAGAYPLKQGQLDVLYTLCAELIDEYGIPLTRKTVLTHAEVQPTLGVAQSGKWDITWLPGDEKPGDPVEVGDRIRYGIELAAADGVAAMNSSTDPNA